VVFATGGIVDVIVDVDNVELGFIDLVDRDVKHGKGLEVPEKNSLPLLGVKGSLVTDRGLLRWCWVLGAGENGEEKDRSQQSVHDDPLVFRKLSITYAGKASFLKALGRLAQSAGKAWSTFHIPVL